MPPSKYTREMSFLNNQMLRYKKLIEQKTATMPSTPEEARAIAAEIEEMQAKIATMQKRFNEIKQSFIDTNLEVPDISRNMNAVVYRSGQNFEVVDPEEIERAAELYRNGGDEDDDESEEEVVVCDSLEDVNAQIKSIGAELISIENRIVEADIDGDEDEKQKLVMMASSLRQRREALVAQAKQMKAAAAAAAAEVPAPAQTAAISEELLQRLEKNEADIAGLRSQISNIRNDVMETKELIREIKDALGIREE